MVLQVSDLRLSSSEAKLIIHRFKLDQKGKGAWHVLRTVGNPQLCPVWGLYLEAQGTVSEWQWNDKVSLGQLPKNTGRGWIVST